MTFHGCHEMANNWKLKCLCSNLYNLSSKNSSRFHITSPFVGESEGGQKYKKRLNLTCGKSYPGLTSSLSWMLLPWFLASPGHQQPWYWLLIPGRSFPYTGKNFKYLRHINVEEYICIYINVYIYACYEKMSHKLVPGRHGGYNHSSITPCNIAESRNDIHSIREWMPMRGPYF